MENKDRLLYELYDQVGMNNTKASAKETQLIKSIEKCEEQLLLTLNKDEEMLLNNLISLTFELNNLNQTEAFAKGVRFATKYLMESLCDC